MSTVAAFVLLQVREAQDFAAPEPTRHLTVLTQLLFVKHAVALTHFLDAALPTAIHPPELAHVSTVVGKVTDTHARAAAFRTVYESQWAELR